MLLLAGIGPTPARQGRLIVIDTRVLDLYGREVEAYFRANRVQYKLLPLKTSKPEKTVENVLRVVRALDELEVDRSSDPLIAIGAESFLMSPASPPASMKGTAPCARAHDPDGSGRR